MSRIFMAKNHRSFSSIRLSRRKRQRPETTPAAGARMQPQNTLEMGVGTAAFKPYKIVFFPKGGGNSVPPVRLRLKAETKVLRPGGVSAGFPQ
jgi:hypothetical protein